MLNPNIMYENIVAKIKDAINIDYANPIIVGGLQLASGLYKIKKDDKVLELARRAGSRIGQLYYQEALRIARKNSIDIHNDPVAKVFFSSISDKDNPEDLNYSRKDDFAIVMNGDGADSEQFRYHISTSKEYLIDEIGFPENNVLTVDAKNGASKITNSSKEIIKKSGDAFSNIVFIYSGHGVNTGFQLKGNTVGYKKWCQPLKSHKGNIVFINNSCNSGGAVNILEKNKILPNKMMYIGSTQANSGSWDDRLIKDVFDSYGSGKRFSATGYKGLIINPNQPDFGKETEVKYVHKGNDFDYILLNNNHGIEIGFVILIS